jgi:2-hydroxychromene-2-carboxylate isomerase
MKMINDQILEFSTMTEIKWYFDFISPFAYLQMAQFSKLPDCIKIKPVPVVFGGLLANWGQLGPAEIPPKRQFVYRFFQWNADRLGIPFKMPPSHPYNPLSSLRLCIAAGSQIDHVRAIYDVIYGRGIQPDSPEGISAMAQELKIMDPELSINNPDVKERLRKNTENAVKDGVFGVPSFVVNGEVFWGGDSTDMMLDYLNDPNLFQSPEMKRISEMPMGKTRKKNDYSF